ncbi:hypothetical protein Goshw_016228 [Gossypium schwendimanii]|uniref:Uncharacterized protein n=1 Tax=Gossypium schwendimanii TaxID=34291 RepID=A0A7J9MCB7_GOSSC|nr:hypothetical protein [Gossypium schwendimanii]
MDGLRWMWMVVCQVLDQGPP